LKEKLDTLHKYYNNYYTLNLTSMKKILLPLVLFFLFIGISNAQSDEWMNITYNYYSGPISPQYQKTYTITINSERVGMIRYHYGMNKRAPSIDSFTVTKANLKKLAKAIKKTGVLNGMQPSDSSDGKIGGSEQTITLVYGNPNPNLDQPVKQATYRLRTDSDKNERNLFTLMDKMVPKKIWKKLETPNEGD